MSDDQLARSTIRVALEQAPALEGLPRDMLERFARSARAARAAAGDVIVREGEPGNSMFVISSGQVRVTVRVRAAEALLAHLGPGEFFGEGALLTGAPRTATVTADEPTELFELDRDTLDAAMEDAPGLRAALEEASAARQDQSRTGVFRNEAQTLIALSPAVQRIAIGSDSTNDIQLPGPGVTPVHAEIFRAGEALTVRALDPELGSTYVNREPVREAELQDGDVIRIGPHRLFLQDGVLKLFRSSLGIRVEAAGLGRTVAGGRRILQDVDLVLYPGELVAIVGVSGAGKTTLLNLLVGLDRPGAGRVAYDGVPVGQHHALFPGAVGFVPQEDIVHRSLTLEESLTYAARLRLPENVRGEARRNRVRAAAASVGLEDRMDVAIGSLSGGQRKRASVAAELLSQPSALFLDEPTSGLDPGLDEQLMHQFRSLADEGRTVILTTHATRNIRLCDRVVVIDGGRLVFAGPPSDALRHFGVDEFTQVYHVLGQGSAAEHEARYRTARESAEAEPASTPTGPERSHATAEHGRRGNRIAGAARQLPTLVSRDWKLASRDRVGLLLRLGGPALLAGSLVLTFKRSIFGLKLEDGGDYLQAITFLYLSSAIGLFLGAFTASGVITSERAIFKRERLIFLSPAGYVVSKVLVLGLFAALQSAILAAVLGAGIRFPDPQERILSEVFAILLLTSIAGMTMGLLVSAVSPNVDRAGILVVLLLIPQLIFAGSTVPRSRMQEPAKLISDVTVTRWSLEALGLTTSITDREFEQAFVEVDPYGIGGEGMLFPVPFSKRPFVFAFRGSATERWAALAGFTVVFTGATMGVLYLGDRSRLRLRRR